MNETDITLKWCVRELVDHQLSSGFYIIWLLPKIKHVISEKYWPIQLIATLNHLLGWHETFNGAHLSQFIYLLADRNGHFLLFSSNTI